MTEWSWFIWPKENILKKKRFTELKLLILMTPYQNFLCGITNNLFLLFIKNQQSTLNFRRIWTNVFNDLTPLWAVKKLKNRNRENQYVQFLEKLFSWILSIEILSGYFMARPTKTSAKQDIYMYIHLWVWQFYLFEINTKYKCPSESGYYALAAALVRSCW